ncbi:MAG: DUF1501 domain-containing protein [Planctomycetia bacterium]|nr:DUF1501 domain-containing protein [Planctomycetia bacterium]
MLTLGDRRGRFGRREFLRIGSLSLGSLSLPGLLAAQAAESKRLLTGRSVIFLFLHGGPSQFETFDPKMAAPAEIRSATGEIATRIPGVTFGSSLPKLAAVADRLAIVRSFTTGDANHDIKPVVGRDTFGANLGSLFARVAGATDPLSGLPRNAVLFPRAVDATAGPHQSGFGRFESAGALGPGYAPFVAGAGGDLQRDMQLNVPADRLTDRRAILAALDAARWNLDAAGRAGTVDKLREQAFETVLGGAAQAFDLSREDPRTIERYDTAPLVRPEAINAKWKNYPHYVDNAKTLGKLLLLARRLCEAGCGFVTVTTNFVWDMHADVNNAPVDEGLRYTGPPLDHAVSALVEDLERRGLSDRILLVCCGEMGRTPRKNPQGGRDHWGNLAPLLLAGGGLPMGRVIGSSTRDGGQPQTEPVGNRNLVATVLQTLVDPGELRIVRGMPNEVVQAATADPIPGLA